MPTHSGALPATFAVPANTFTGSLYFGIWVPDTHPITSITEDGGSINQIGVFSPVALNVGAAGMSYESDNIFLAEPAITNWRIA